MRQVFQTCVIMYFVTYLMNKTSSIEKVAFDLLALPVVRDSVRNICSDPSTFYSLVVKLYKIEKCRNRIYVTLEDSSYLDHQDVILCLESAGKVVRSYTRLDARRAQQRSNGTFPSVRRASK